MGEGGGEGASVPNKKRPGRTEAFSILCNQKGSKASIGLFAFFLGAAGAGFGHSSAGGTFGDPGRFAGQAT